MSFIIFIDVFRQSQTFWITSVVWDWSCDSNMIAKHPHQAHQETLKIGIVIIIKMITAIVRKQPLLPVFKCHKQVAEFLYFSSFYRLGIKTRVKSFVQSWEALTIREVVFTYNTYTYTKEHK